MHPRFDLIVAVAVVFLAVIGSTSAYRKLCITGDNFITGVYMANDTKTNYVDKMRHSSQVRKFDCVVMPPNPTVIAVEAFNAKGWAGILSYETGVGAPYRDWKCAAAADITDPDWMTTNFDDSHWAAAKHFGLVWHRNRDLAFVRKARKHHAYSWVWTSRVHDKFKHVYCRLKLCDDNCKSCSIAEQGSCDPGMCTMGSFPDPDTGLDRCNHKCSLKIKSWGPPATSGPQLVMVTDLVTKSVQRWPGDPIWDTTAAGDYAGILDMRSCTITNAVYDTLAESFTFPPDPNHVTVTAYLSQWAGDSSNDGAWAFQFWIGNASCVPPVGGLPVCGIPIVNLFQLPNLNIPDLAGNRGQTEFSGIATGVQFNSTWTGVHIGP